MDRDLTGTIQGHGSVERDGEHTENDASQSTHTVFNL